MKLAPTIGIAVDHRRRNRSLESLQVGLRPPQWHYAFKQGTGIGAGFSAAHSCRSPQLEACSVVSSTNRQCASMMESVGSCCQYGHR